MKRILLDHFRRRAWIFALGAVIQLGLGWGLAFFATRRGDSPLTIFQVQLGLFMGAFLLAYDLNRGIARTLAALPLTTREIGRAWWLATVGLPAPVFSALLVLGALAHHAVHPDIAIVWDQLAGSALTLLLILGAAFTLVFKLPAHPGEARGWQRVINLAAGLALGLLFSSGFLYSKYLTNSPANLILLLALGVAFSVIGWFRADRFIRGRVAARPVPADTAPRSMTPHRADGLGGLPLLLASGFLRVFRTVLAMLAGIALFTALQGRIHSWPELVQQLCRAGYYPLGFFAFLLLAPFFQQLRLLRSLPLSTQGLAATLLALILLPLLAIGVLTTGIGWTVGPAEARLAAMICLLSLPPAGWMMATIVWQGLRTSSYALIFFLMTVVQVGFVWLQTHHAAGLSLGLVALVAGAGVVLAFFLTRLALQRGNRAYRTPGAGGFAPVWAAGR